MVSLLEALRVTVSPESASNLNPIIMSVNSEENKNWVRPQLSEFIIRSLSNVSGSGTASAKRPGLVRLDRNYTALHRGSMRGKMCTGHASDDKFAKAN